ncbi:hypothetical protein BGZ94_007766 [Podila epigama]|nr:hypothetical protein BGZ94_007766 [Podila epigama]
MSSIRRLKQIYSQLAIAPVTGTSRTPKLVQDRAVATDSALHKLNDLSKKDRAFYAYGLDIQTRWADNDQYGHLNNAHYYALFDTVINTFLIQEAGLNPHEEGSGVAIGVVAESGCQYYSSLSFPDVIEGRLGVSRIGRSSVVYQVGIFKKLESESLPAKTTHQMSTRPGRMGKFLDDEEAATLIRGDAAASGNFCHVFVDKTTRVPVPIPAKIRAGLERLLRG